MAPRVAALLAGGRSVRMGRDKAFLTRHGQPLWKHQAETLRQAGVTRWLLSCRCEQGLDIAAADWSAAHGMAMQMVLDPSQDSAGVLGAVARCLRAARQGLLILTVDMPHLDRTMLDPLWPLPELDIGGFWAGPRGIEPFPGFYPFSLLPALDEALRQTRASSLTRLLESARADGQIRAKSITVENAWRLANWNRPEDVADAADFS